MPISLRRALRALAVGSLSGLGLLLASCTGGSPDEDPASLAAYVLVDLSETWNNPASSDANRAILTEIGEGIATAADDLDPPIGVEYRVIGATSLGRRPECTAVYQPTFGNLAPLNPSLDRVLTPEKLHEVLGQTCPGRLLGHPPEPLTEI